MTYTLKVASYINLLPGTNKFGKTLDVILHIEEVHHSSLSYSIKASNQLSLVPFQVHGYKKVEAKHGLLLVTVL